PSRTSTRRARSARFGRHSRGRRDPRGVRRVPARSLRCRHTPVAHASQRAGYAVRRGSGGPLGQVGGRFVRVVAAARVVTAAREISFTADGARLQGTLAVPDGARGVVLFAHGSGSSRHSPRNRYVADVLNDGGLATLLIDLL